MRGLAALLLPLVSAAGNVYPYMAPLLETRDGVPVTSADQWRTQRRAEVSQLLQEHVIGTWPTAPPLLKAEELNRTSFASGAVGMFVQLTFYTMTGNVSFIIEVLHPMTKKPAPVFLTQWNHRGWALAGLGRGYLGVVYPGADTGDAAPLFQAAYPNTTMMLIAARAFVASRVLDYVLTSVPGIATEQVAISGHSRNGKQSILAAALDERITAVVGSSPGAPISSPYAFSSHNFYGEGPDAGQAGHWWLQGTAAYAAAPQTLPMDGHGVLALVAPRFLAVADGYTDHEGDDTFADEMGVRAAAQVYSLLGADTHLRLIHRPGDHHGFLDVHTYFDWFDHAFKRSQGPKFPLAWTGQQKPSDPWPQNYLTPAGFDWEVWNASFGSATPAPPGPEAPFEQRMSWLLQLNEPTADARGSSYSEDGVQGDRFSYRSVMMGVDIENHDKTVKRHPVSFGDYVTGNVYWPASANKSENLPVVVWLHPYSYSVGYAACYESSDVVRSMVNAGYAVLAYDQVGHATRLLEGGTTFYNRYGDAASLMGHMVRDARAAVDFLQCRGVNTRDSTACNDHESHGGAYPNKLLEFPSIDVGRIIFAGYSMGGNVALHTAALDSRIAGVAAFAAFTPMRTDSLDRPTYGLRRLYDLHAMIPRLGLYAGEPGAVPYDYDELLATIAPRKTLIYSPKQDHDATYADVAACVSKVKPAWASSPADLTFKNPDTYTKMAKDEVQALLTWLWAFKETLPSVV